MEAAIWVLIGIIIGLGAGLLLTVWLIRDIQKPERLRNKIPGPSRSTPPPPSKATPLPKPTKNEKL